MNIRQAMKAGLTRIIPAVALVLAVLFSSALQSAYETDGPIDFSLQQLGGGTMSVSDFRGQWVVVNYWATWCAPCRKEIPELSELHLERGDITVLGLAFEEAGPEEFEEFLAEFQPAYPILLVDVFDPPEPVGAPRVLPTTLLLEPGGRSVKAFVGPVTRHQIEEFVDAYPDQAAE